MTPKKSMRFGQSSYICKINNNNSLNPCKFTLETYQLTKIWLAKSLKSKGKIDYLGP